MFRTRREGRVVAGGGVGLCVGVDISVFVGVRNFGLIHFCLEEWQGFAELLGRDKEGLFSYSTFSPFLLLLFLPLRPPPFLLAHLSLLFQVTRRGAHHLVGISPPSLPLECAA